MNPFEMKPAKKAELIVDWEKLWPQSYDKNCVDPYTRTRIILMNGTEFEANWFSHQMARHIEDPDLKRELALTRMVEKQQQIKGSLLKPKDESILEHTISYEQLAVDLTSELAKRELDCNVKTALDFALLEDFDQEIVLKVDEYQLAFNETLLENVNLELAPGEKVAIVGANGTGKTTSRIKVCCQSYGTLRLNSTTTSK